MTVIRIGGVTVFAVFVSILTTAASGSGREQVKALVAIKAAAKTPEFVGMPLGLLTHGNVRLNAVAANDYDKLIVRADDEPLHGPILYG